MRAKRLAFIVTLYLMALSSFVVFAGNMSSWVQFRFFSKPATLFVLPDPRIDGPEDERRMAADLAARGTPVRLELRSGEKITTHARLGALTDDQLRMARGQAGVEVLFRRENGQTARVVSGMDEVESPWLWLVLFVAFAVVANLARKLPTT